MWRGAVLNCKKPNSKNTNIKLFLTENNIWNCHFYMSLTLSNAITFFLMIYYYIEYKKKYKNIQFNDTIYNEALILIDNLLLTLNNIQI